MERRKRWLGTRPTSGGPWDVDYSIGVRNHVLYQTTSGNLMPMLIDVHRLQASDMPLLSKEERMVACGDCSGYNGGCPKYAPTFQQLSRKKPHCLVVALHFDMVWAVLYATPKPLPGLEKTRPYMQQRYVNRLTENYMEAVRRAVMTRALAERGNWTSLTLGNCKGCSSPKKCAVVQGKPCLHRERRCFSMESVGIDVDKLHVECYAEQLPWYDKTVPYIPTYMSRYIAFLLKRPIEFEDDMVVQNAILTHKAIAQGHTGDWSTLIKTKPDLRRKIVTVAHEQKMWVYVDPILFPEEVEHGKDKDKVKSRKGKATVRITRKQGRQGISRKKSRKEDKGGSHKAKRIRIRHRS